MKISLCITVFNEEKSIDKLIKSILSQTKVPDEVIIVDAGSEDNTVEIIKQYPRIKLYISKKASIAKGRNLAVKKAKFPIIAMTDAGCICHNNWLKKITRPFDNRKTDVAAGFYKMTGNSKFQKALKPYLGVVPSKFNEYKFLPLARSIAFKKSAWKKMGGFCEKFDRAGEDYDFSNKIIKNNLNIVREKEALVDWEVPDGIFPALKKFFYYSRGDAQSKNLLSSHNIHTYSIFARYFLLLLILAINPLVFLITLFAYLFWAYWKAGLWGTIIQIGSDIVIMVGFVDGIWAIQNK